MSSVEIELNPVDFVTVGTIGPKGKRVFHLQAGKGKQLVSLVIEKEQAWALSDAIKELMEDLDNRFPHQQTELDLSTIDMELREPIEPVFRVAQMALGYDEERDLVVLVAQELVVTDPERAEKPQPTNPGVVRMWCSRPQMRALSLHAMSAVQAGRADPKQNGRLVYYWL
ncbi:MAG: DUF3090 family protein [Chloroflexi bacterium]|nr:DUF3090 family protein [Chloroflexota bacterium]